ncbi:MAG: hypothetical protein LUG95_08870 [Clostridiales bacterium]|nr:hypothetical protein [Clostridiales bacterium]
MKKFFQNLGYRFQRFMAGRYGTDALWKVLFVLWFVLTILGYILRSFSTAAYYVCYVFSLAVIIFALFRMFSKNISARRRENESWLRFAGNIKKNFNFTKTRFQQRKTHKFVKCKGCKKVLRLPKNKGKIRVTCPHCNNQFTVNTGKKSAAKANG